MSSVPAAAPHPRIVVGFDGSDDAVAALEFACDEARGREADIQVLHAVDDSMLNSAWGIVFDIDAYRRTGEILIDRAREIAASHGIIGDRFSGDVLVGQPMALLLHASEHASVVVVGRRAEPGTDQAFVGSTGVGLAGQASCPVIIVSELARRHEHTGVVSVAIDSVQQTSPAVAWGFLRAARLGSRLQVVTIVTRPRGRLFALAGTTNEQMDAAAAEAGRRLEAMLQHFREQYPAVDAVVSVRKSESAAEELIAVSRESDLLIVAVHAAFPTYNIGGTVRALMAHSACPLGIVRQRV